MDRPLPKPGERYRHFKNKKIYEVVGIAAHTENRDQLVVYKNEEGQLFARPLKIFMGRVYPRCGTRFRFTRVGEGE